MKRIIAALSLAALTAPAAAAGYGAPFEQTQLDRQLPDVALTKAADPHVVNGMPFEQNELDRGVPLQDDTAIRFASLGGSTMSDSSSATAYSNGSDESPWANDHNVIAPAP